jgi:ABC-type multidrug transport system ATPase subunit
VIHAEGVFVHFSRGWFRGVTRALDGLDLEIREGDFFALLGQNGAGKSTAMYCLLGLLRPTKGTVSLLGKPPELGSDTYRYVSYLPEEPHYHDYLTVQEAVSYYGALYGAPVPRKLLDDTLERLRLAEHRKLALRKCSKGMKQKVGIAQCLVNTEARVLFLDEPMRGLDPLTVRDFREILIERNRAGATIVMNSHILAEVELVANRAAIIDRGKVVAQDELSRLARVERGFLRRRARRPSRATLLPLARKRGRGPSTRQPAGREAVRALRLHSCQQLGDRERVPAQDDARGLVHEGLGPRGASCLASCSSTRTSTCASTCAIGSCWRSGS